MDRLEMLKQILEQNPTDSFARYGLAMEYSKAGQTDIAIQEFKTLLASNPDYTSAYFQAAQTYANAERFEEAKAMLRDGIACAQRTSNSHARSEMEAMLDELG